MVMTVSVTVLTGMGCLGASVVRGAEPSTVWPAGQTVVVRMTASVTTFWVYLAGQSGTSMAQLVMV